MTASQPHKFGSAVDSRRCASFPGFFRPKLIEKCLSMINFDVSWNYVQPLTKVQKRKVVEQIEQRVNELKS